MFERRLLLATLAIAAGCSSTGEGPDTSALDASVHLDAAARPDTGGPIDAASLPDATEPDATEPDASVSFDAEPADGGDHPDASCGDDDGDGVCNEDDLCPAGDDADDGDDDLVPDACDPCPGDNPDDLDGDGVCESADICPLGPDTNDRDSDGVPDDCDNCASVSNPLQEDGSGVAAFAIPFSFRTATVAHTLSLADDELGAPIPIGFTFEFFGRAYDELAISPNGFITFTTTTAANGCCSGDWIPEHTDHNNAIALAWSDLYPPGGGTISHATIGTPPTRALLVTFDGVPLFGSTSTVSVQAVLFEQTNRIEIHTRFQPAGAVWTRGVEDLAGREAALIRDERGVDRMLIQDAVGFTTAARPDAIGDACSNSRIDQRPVPSGAMDHALTRVPCNTGAYDFKVRAKTVPDAPDTDPGTSDPVYMSLTAHQTMERYSGYLWLSGAWSADTWIEACFEAHDGKHLSDMKSFVVGVEPPAACGSSDGVTIDDIELYDESGDLYFEMDVDDGEEVTALVDGDHELEPSDGHTYAVAVMAVLYPDTATLPAGDGNDRTVRVRMIMDDDTNAGGPISALRFKFYPRNKTEPAVIAPGSDNAGDTTLDPGGDHRFDVVLPERYGNYARLEIENTSNNAFMVQDVHVLQKDSTSDAWFVAFERDVNDDGVDWTTTIEAGSILFNVGGHHHRSAWVGGNPGPGESPIRVETAFTGPDNWDVRDEGFGAIGSAYMDALSEVPAAADLPEDNPVFMAIYKCALHGKCQFIYDKLAASGAKDGVHETHAYFLQGSEVEVIEGSDVQDWKVGSDSSRRGVFNNGTECIDAGECSSPTFQMHNKLIMAKHHTVTDFAGAPIDPGMVVVSTSNLQEASQDERFNSLLRVAGVPEYWRKYAVYFGNLMKYDHNVDVIHGLSASDGFIPDLARRTNTTPGVDQWNADVDCDDNGGTHCAQNLSGADDDYHEFGSAYDAVVDAPGDRLSFNIWFQPRPQSAGCRQGVADNFPVRDVCQGAEVAPWFIVIDDLYNWLQSRPNRRLEVYLMQLTDSDPQAVRRLRELVDHDRAQVMAVFSPESTKHDNVITSPRRFWARHAERAGSPEHVMHEKTLLARKWENIGGTWRVAGYEIVTGSTNFKEDDRIHRDNNMVRMAYKSSARLTPHDEAFERQVFRPYLDHFVAAFNDHEHTNWIGSRRYCP